MTKTESLMADLEQASRIAQEGEITPLLGGPVGLMWGVLITLIMGFQYLVLSRILEIPYASLTIAWIAFGTIGGLGSAILGRAIDRKPGANSVANRVESYVWIMYAGTMGALFIGAVLNMIFGNGDQTLWNTVVVFAFAAQGLAYGVVAKVTKLKLLHLSSIASFAVSSVLFIMVDRIEVYLVAAIGAVLTIVIPNLILNAKIKQNVQ